MGECLGGSLGEVVKVDVREQGFSMGKFLRVRVDINFSEPLCKGRMVRMGGPTLVWVDFCYERLPIFCYWCGKLDNDDRDCPLWIQSKESLGPKDKQFGPWLRAESKRLQRPLVAEGPKSLTRKNKPTTKGEPKRGDQSKNWRTSPASGRKETRAAVGTPEFERVLITGEINLIDMVIDEEMVQNKKQANFDDQLVEIDQAINGEKITRMGVLERAGYSPENVE